MKTDFQAIITHITAQYGVSVFENAPRLKALFADLARDVPKPQKTVFLSCVEHGYMAILQNAENREECKAELARRLHDEEGFDGGLCAEALETLEKGLFPPLPPPVKTCAKCGKELQPEWKACPFCGAGKTEWNSSAGNQIPVLENKNTVTRNIKNKKSTFIFAALALLVLAGAAGVISYKYIAVNSHIKKGENYLTDSEYDAALAEFEIAIQRDPKNDGGYAGRGEAYRQKGEKEKSMNDFNAAISLNPKNHLAYARRGRAYWAGEGDKDKAVSDLTQSLNIKPTEFAYLERGNILGLDWFIEYSVAKMLDNEIDAKITTKYDTAISDYTEALKMNPNSKIAYSGRAWIYKGAEEYDKSISDYQNVIRLDASNDYAYQNLGEIYAAKDMPDEAMENFNSAIEINPKNNEALKGRGNLFVNDKKYDDAIKDFTAYIELADKPDNAIYLKRGLLYAMAASADDDLNDAKKNDLYNKTLKDANVFINNDAGNHLAYYLRGLANMELTHYSAAINDLNKSLALNPNNTSTKALLAEARRLQRQSAAAPFVASPAFKPAASLQKPVPAAAAPAARTSAAPPPLARQQSANMVWINGGTFTMGSPASESERYDDEAQHSVTVSSFYLCKYEVTQREWRDVMGNNPSNFKGDNLPVETVSWYDVVEYCNKRSEREGLTPAYTINGTNVTWNRYASGYRLPTEAEWEYACRAGTSAPYYTGSSVDAAGWYSSNSGSTTHSVGQKQSNAWGLYDMHGNVYEWCWDWKGDYGWGAQTNPTGAGSGSHRVQRGGSWGFFSAKYLRSAYRDGSLPSYRSSGIGFRLARNGW